MKEPEKVEGTKKTRPSKTTKQSPYELTEAEAGSTRLSWVCTRSSVQILYLPIECFYGIPDCAKECVSDYCAFS